MTEKRIAWLILLAMIALAVWWMSAAGGCL
jgi:hypothetical protein